MAMFLIYGIFLVAFSGESLVEYNIIPPAITLVTEAFVYLLFLYSLIVTPPERKGFRIHLLPLFLCFLFFTFLSVILNDFFSLRPVFSLRLILRFYVFYLALINLDFNEIQQKKINAFLFFLFIIQLPASAIKFCFYGVSELTMGTYTVRGGGLTTVIPVVALGYLSAYYTHYKKNMWFVVLAVGFILYGIVGAKAALLFIYPVVFLGLYYLNIIREKGVRIGQDLIISIAIFLGIVLVSVVIVKYQPRLNPERDVGGSVDFKYALEYSKKYSTNMNSRDERFAGGRLATMMLAFTTFMEADFGNKVLGFGPGVLSESVLKKNVFVDNRVYRVAGSYGITGMIYFIFEYGFVGFLCLGTVFIVFVRLCWKCLNLESDRYWKAFASGSLVFSGYLFLIFCFYNKLPILDDTITPVFYYVMSVMYYRLYVTLK